MTVAQLMIALDEFPGAAEVTITFWADDPADPAPGSAAERPDPRGIIHICGDKENVYLLAAASAQVIE